MDRSVPHSRAVLISSVQLPCCHHDVAMAAERSRVDARRLAEGGSNFGKKKKWNARRMRRKRARRRSSRCFLTNAKEEQRRRDLQINRQSKWKKKKIRLRSLGIETIIPD